MSSTGTGEGRTGSRRRQSRANNYSISNINRKRKANYMRLGNSCVRHAKKIPTPQEKQVNKNKFYSSKEAIFLDSVDLSKIIVSSKWKISDTKYKYFCGYINNGVIQPLCVILPQMRGYIKYFDDGGKNMSFVTDDKKVY